MEGSLARFLERNDKPGLGKYLAGITTDERLMAVVLCHDGALYYKTERTPSEMADVAASVLALTLGFISWLFLRRCVNVLVGDIRGRRYLDDAHSEPGSRPILTQIRRVLREVEHRQRLEIDFHENWTIEEIWCRRRVSNSRPPDYKSGALPTELLRQVVLVRALFWAHGSRAASEAFPCM